MASMGMKLSFNGNAFEKGWYGLIDYENHLIQQFSFFRCSQVLQGRLSEKFT